MYERTLSGVLGPYFAQIKQIGTGGNGRVLSAIDTRFDFPVCIKRISVANKDECRATLREIRIRRRLRHENIVGLLNAIVSDGTDVSEITPANFRDTTCVYLVQELLDADLRQVIESYTRLSDEYVKLFFYQMLRGLKYIHSANVLHRDLKPSNIMININSLQLMIGDFGHSMVLDPDYTHGNSLTVCSTSLWYKAPELILGTAQYSTSSDIWAAGCILAEMLLGRPLFEGENELEQLEMIIHAIKVDEKDQFFVREYLTEAANSMYSGKPKFPLQLKFQKVDFHALHLLEHLLSFNADDRVTTELALSHPFLQEYACSADEPVCLKPLHLEHEVDDFLEYTLKDLIVGECVALAEEQPRIHLQMSSYSSLTDIAKDCNNSPCESSSQSMDDGRPGLELKTVSEDYDELSNESEGNRFKVLEVLKEEHGSSSDSNGLAAHEEGVSEAPLVLDHPMFSSSRWENERYRSSGHRRHHSHHRRKQTDESKSRRRKLSRDEKSHLKSPCSDHEPTLDSTQATGESLPQIHLLGDETTGMNVAGFSNPGDELSAILSPDVEVHLASNSESTIGMEGQDDKVQELIMRSRQLIADQTAIMDDVPAITDICSSSKPSVGVFMETADEKAKKSKLEKSFISSSADDLSMLNHRKRVVDRGVADVIRRSQELLGELPTASALEEESVLANESDSVQDLISRSEQLLKSTRVLRSTTPEHNPCATEERRALTNDTVDDLISKSEELCMSHEITERIRNLNTARNGEANVEKFSSEFTLEDNFFNHPLPHTGNSSDLTTELPPAKHLQSFDPSTTVHSSLEDNIYTPWTTPSNHPQPITDAPTNSLQPTLSDPYHLRESNRRMQELLEESHNLIKHLKADRMLCSEFVPGPPEDQFRKVPVHEGDFENNEEFGERKTIKTETFHERLDGMNLEEMKLVLDEAKKLLEKSNNLDISNVAESPDIEQCMNDMDIENATDGEDCVEKFTTMEIDEIMKGGECGNVKSAAMELRFNSCKSWDVDEKATTVDLEVIKEDCESHKDNLKDLLCLQNQLDFVLVVQDPTAATEQAAISEVIKIKRSPPLEKQTSRPNCLARSQDSSITKNMEESDELGERIAQINGGVDGSPFQHDKEVLVKKRSNDALSEAIDDNSHKHFKNSGLTLPNVTMSCEEVGKTLEENIRLEIGVVQNRTQHKEYDSNQLRLNGIRTTTLDLNVRKRLIDSNVQANVVFSKNCQNENVGKAKKLLPKCETVDKDNCSSRVIEEINSDDVVEKLYGTTCRMENNAKRINSKDSARLQNFYAALKIKSIMRNRTRPHREKRYDTYPF